VRYTKDKLLDLIEKHYLASHYKEAIVLAEKAKKKYLESKGDPSKFTKKANKLYQREVIRNYSLLAYRHSPSDGVIYLTLKEKKMLSLFQECNKIIYIGCGYYPFSLFNLHKKYKHLELIGVERDKIAFLSSFQLVNNSPAKNNLKIKHCDGIDFDFNSLDDKDLVFIAPEIDHKNITNRIISQSLVKFFKCSMSYNKEWLGEFLNDKKN